MEMKCVQLLPRGRLVVFSGLPPAGDRLEVSLNQLHYHEQSIVGAYGCAYRHGVAALNLIAAGIEQSREILDTGRQAGLADRR